MVLSDIRSKYITHSFVKMKMYDINLPCLWHICKVSYNVLLIAILYLRSSFYQIWRIMQLPIAIDVDICPRLQQYLSLSSPLIDQKNIIFLWAWGQQRISYRRFQVRERKKKVALFYACVHIIVFRPTLCR